MRDAACPISTGGGRKDHETTGSATTARTTWRRGRLGGRAQRETFNDRSNDNEQHFGEAEAVRGFVLRAQVFEPWAAELQGPMGRRAGGGLLHITRGRRPRARRALRRRRSQSCHTPRTPGARQETPASASGRARGVSRFTSHHRNTFRPGIRGSFSTPPKHTRNRARPLVPPPPPLVLIGHAASFTPY